MQTTKQPKNTWAKVKFYIGVGVLSAGTLYSVREVSENQMAIIALGILVTFFCVDAVVSFINKK